MHENFGVFRREEQMQKQGGSSRACASATEVVIEDKGEVFNWDLTQAIELGFMLELAACMVRRDRAQGEPRRARPAARLPDRDDENFMKHTIVPLGGRSAERSTGKDRAVHEIPAARRRGQLR